MNGATTTFVSPAGFTYKATISDVKVYTGATAASPIGTQITSGTNFVLNANVPNSWSGNNFPTAYSGFRNFTTNPPTAVADSNAVITTDNLYGGVGGGNRVTYRLTVEATDPLGVKGNATGIVLAGSESLNGTGEWYSLSAPQGRIRYIDKYIRSTASWNNYSVQLKISNAGRKVFVTNPGGGDSRGDAMLFAEDVPYVDAEVKGGGGQSIAIGFLEELDYSDAPQSYGSAFHLLENKFSGGTFADGNITLNTNSNSADLTAANGQLAKFSDPTLRLGADIDSEDNPWASLPATNVGTPTPNWDDTNGQDDEDALNTTTTNVNGFMSVAYVNISPLKSYLNIWIDKNNNGTFESTEKLTKEIPANKSGNAIFDLSSLGLADGKYYTRIRYSSANNLNQTGYAPDGEVEDHLITAVSNSYNILGNVYQDGNASTPDGSALYGLTVNLYNNSGTLVATTTTNYEGQYMFTGLSAGNYRVDVVSPANMRHVSSTDTTPTNGSTNVTVSTANVMGINFGLYFSGECYKTPPVVSGGSPTTHGITNLGRAGKDNGNWPMVRTGAWTALESKTKGFVINRVAANYEPPLDDGQIPAIIEPVKGMMVYDTTNHCLKIYDGVAWKCFNVQSCPPVN